MDDFYIGLITTIVILTLLELFRFLDKRLVAAFTLVGIPFIYIGFAWHDIPSLVFVVAAALLFIAMSYYGYKCNFMLIIFGLVLHGAWDLLFPFISSEAPEGYDVFCMTVDFLLALYFFIRVKPLKRLAKEKVNAFDNSNIL